MDELSIWTLKGGEAGTVEAVQTVSKSDLLESRLEETLVRRPDMLEPGIQLVGRQTPTDGGPSDLLGVNKHGRLVIFELKRAAITRDAVTQCIDYASALDAMDPETLANHIAKCSGHGGIKAIENFETWYEEHFDENEISALLPPRMVLVGLGVDARAERMARFLQAGGIDITVLTFYGFQHGGETLLARQVEVEHDSQPNSRRRGYKSPSEKRQDLADNLSERGLSDLFESIRQALATALPNSSQRTGSEGVSFILRQDGSERRICRLLAGDGERLKGNYVHLDTTTAIYEEDVLSGIITNAKSAGWYSIHNGEGLGIAIDNTEDWERKGQAIAEFLKEAAALRRKAPATDAP